jgi:hypothetical protein
MIHQLITLDFIQTDSMILVTFQTHYTTRQNTPPHDHHDGGVDDNHRFHKNAYASLGCFYPLTLQWNNPSSIPQLHIFSALLSLTARNASCFLQLHLR